MIYHKIRYDENGNKQYYINDKLHNDKGPAFIYYDENGNKKYEEYWLYNKKMKKDEYYAKLGG